ncbi:MAG: ATP-binding protein [Candidatus Eremiobacteraeota bacterium]|nr:ATP-binding protein [Candidatus Eremiobacteraeota bacterium]
MKDRQALHAEIAYKYILNDASLLLLFFDDRGTVTAVNAFTRALLGEEPEQRSFRDVFVDFQKRFSLESLADDPSTTTMMEVSTARRMPRTFLTRFFRCGDEFMAIGREDTESQEILSHEIISLNTELSSLARELQKSNAELEKLNRLKNLFLGMAAHDLRNPIGNIIMCSDFLMEDAFKLLSSNDQELLTAIKSQSQFMKQIVDDFLNLAVMESGQLSLNLTASSLHETTTKAVNDMKFAAGKKNIPLLLNDESDLPPVLLDSSKMQQALMNFMKNAIEHSPPGSAVQVSIGRDSDNAFVSIRDEGMGMSREEQNKLFRPFQGGLSKKTAGEKSVGLGLVISSKIIEAHGGKIIVESAPQKGTTFKAVLPLSRLLPESPEDHSSLPGTGDTGHGLVPHIPGPGEIA